MKKLIAGFALLLACMTANADGLLQNAGMKPPVSDDARATLLTIRHCTEGYGCADTRLDRIFKNLRACDSAGRDSIVHFLMEDAEKGIEGHTVSYSCL
jgi:NAD-dependent SIR2 family protein deacetylase